jgi:hypothetical protein
MLTLAAWLLPHRQPSAALVQFEIGAPAKSEFSGFGSAISPDGRYVAFVAVTEGKERLWLRPLDAQNARVLEDTDGAQFPFWSPDSGSIGFFTGNKLKRFDLNGGGLRTLAITANGRGGAWSRDGVIVYSPKLSSRLWKVPATGGEPVPATILDGSRETHVITSPNFLRMAGIFSSTPTVPISEDRGLTSDRWMTRPRSKRFRNCAATPFRRSMRLQEIPGTAISFTFETGRSSPSLSTRALSAWKASRSQSYRAILSTLRLLPVS